MATIPVNDNMIQMKGHRGEISPCRYCRPEEQLLGTACKWCMGNGYTAVCLNCGGTGSETVNAIWGSRTKYSSTCNICGGKGMLPARKVEYHPAPGTETDTDAARDLSPSAVKPMTNLDIHRTQTAVNNADGAGI